MGRVIPLNFYTSVAPGTKKSVVIKRRLDFKYKVRFMACRHDLNDQQKTKVAFFVNRQANAVSGVEPDGVNLIKEYSQHDYFVGDGEVRHMRIDHDVHDEGTYIHMYVENTDTFTHEVWGYVEIERKEGK